MITNESYVAKAQLTAERLLVLKSPESYSDALTLGTLQGLVANKSTEQIIFSEGAFDAYLPILKKEFGCHAAYKDENREEWNAKNLLSYFMPLVDGYILTKSDKSSECTYVAISLSAPLNAVVVTEENEQVAKDTGLAMLIDARELDDNWLRSSPFWSNINRDIAVEQPLSEAPRLIDYAVMTGAYFSIYNGKDQDAHTEKYRYLNDGATVYGWNATLGEYDTVMSFAKLNACLVPADHAYNISTLSSFDLDSIMQSTKSLSERYSERKHTACFVMSDGDNIQWLLNKYMTDEKWYASRHRGKFSLGWGLPATTIDVAPAMVKYAYDNMTDEDEFIMQLSGVGYTFPSYWDKTELEKMASKVSDYMDRMNMKYAEILDDEGFCVEHFDPFTKQEGIDGIFYIDYWNYAGMKGDILWSNEKPVVSAKYRLWAELEDGQIDYIANAINSSSTDPASPEAYSFIIVHCWSGLDREGNLVPDGNTVDAVKAVIDKLSRDVDVVTPSEFMTRVIANLK